MHVAALSGNCLRTGGAARFTRLGHLVHGPNVGSVEGAMGTHEWIAMILGIFFSCLVGFGLMGLMFFSSREGYDEPPTYIQENDDDRNV